MMKLTDEEKRELKRQNKILTEFMQKYLQINQIRECPDCKEWIDAHPAFRHQGKQRLGKNGWYHVTPLGKRIHKKVITLKQK